MFYINLLIIFLAYKISSSATINGRYGTSPPPQSPVRPQSAMALNRRQGNNSSSGNLESSKFITNKQSSFNNQTVKSISFSSCDLRKQNSSIAKSLNGGISSHLNSTPTRSASPTIVISSPTSTCFESENFVDNTVVSASFLPFLPSSISTSNESLTILATDKQKTNNNAVTQKQQTYTSIFNLKAMQQIPITI